MAIPAKVFLKKGKEYSIERYHPWIFSGAIQRIDGDARDGCWVDVHHSNGKMLGSGHYQQGSIAVRVISFGGTSATPELYKTKLQKALALRREINLPSDDTNCFRLIHGEGDGLPGLIIDYYDGAAVVQAHSMGMHVDREVICSSLQEVLGSQLKSVYYKSQTTLPGKAGNEKHDGYLYGLGGVPHVIVEHSQKFYVDWEEGQKTGFFIDQRESRKLLREFVAGKKVLNTFCYTGGFSIYAINGGAELVHSVDSSEKAINTARRNIELNHFNEQTHRCFAADCFEFMKDKHDSYDVIVLDPPAFAKRRDSRHQAIKGYQRLNADAMRIIKPGGKIFTFSCSQVVDKKLFYDTVASAAIQSGRQIKVLHQLSQPADHPVSMFHPEGEYLKGLVLYVE